MKASGYARPRGRSRSRNTGKGIGISERAPGGGEMSFTVRLPAQGPVTVEAPIFEQGTGTYTTVQQVVAEELGLPAARVVVQPVDTDAVPSAAGVGGSRMTRITTGAAFAACQDLAKPAAHFHQQLGLEWY